MANSFESNITYSIGHVSKGRNLLYQILFDSFFLIFHMDTPAYFKNFIDNIV